MSLTDLLRDDFAKRPKGFRSSEVPGAERAVSSAIDRALRKGLLHRAQVSYRHVVYFGDARAAMKFEALHAQSPSAGQARFNARPSRATSMQDKGDAVIPSNVRVQSIPGIERIYDRPPERVIGGFASMGVGRYL